MQTSKFGKIVGWIGAVIFCIPLLPYVWIALNQHSVINLGWIFLITWLLGVLFIFIYIMETNFRKKIYQFPLWLACIANIVFTVYLCYIKIAF